MTEREQTDHRILSLRRYGDLLTCREIAEEIGVPETRVHRVLRNAGMQRERRGVDKRTRSKA